MRMSASKMKRWMECPLSAHFHYDQHLPSRQNAKASFGSIIHHALELYNNTGNIDQAIDTFRKYWYDPAKLGVAPDYWPKMTDYAGLRDRGVEILKAVHEQTKWDTREVIATEHPFLVPFGRHELTGFVDLIEIRRSGKGKNLLRIVDYKAEPLDTLTLTPTGWVKFGDLQVGDEVIGSDGRPTAVLGVYPQGLRRVVRLTFSDGSSADCSPEHLWSVTDLYGIARVLPVKDFLGLRKGHNHRYSIPTVSPVEFRPEKPLPVDPYVLGVWIGDGTKGLGVTLTKPDVLLQERVASRLPDGHELRVVDAATGLCSIVGRGGGARSNEVLNGLRELGLLGLGSKDRFIPEPYLRASIDDRRELLAGLMDADGSSSNRIQFRTSSALLRDGFLELCRSLGGVPHWSRFESYYTKQGERHDCAESYHMTPAVPFNPFGARTKGDGWKPSVHRQNRWITDVEWLDEEVEMQCIRVAANDGLYVTKDYVVTHNTSSRKPTRAELMLDIQFTIYLLASHQKEFWTGYPGEPDFPGIPDGEFHFEALRDMPRRAIWFHLWAQTELDAGDRDDDDYMRLYRLANEIEKADAAQIHVPRIGEACGICDHQAACGIRIPTPEEVAEDPNAWV